MGQKVLRPATALALLAGVSVIAAGAWASMEVVAPDGRRVVLRDDKTWDYADRGAPQERLLLTVAKRMELPNACRYGLRLTNNAGVRVQSIVPQFSAFTREGVVFETVFAAFTQVKPTLDEYQEITFKGIRCDDIERIRVHGADRCSLGDLTKFSPATGECLGYIEVQSSELVAISK